MVRRKGELNSQGIDKGWPHQIALRAEATMASAMSRRDCSAKTFRFARAATASLRDGGYWNVWCFAVRADAEKFRAQFGGEFLDPKDRPKWPGKSRRCEQREEMSIVSITTTLKRTAEGFEFRGSAEQANGQTLAYGPVTLARMKPAPRTKTCWMYSRCFRKKCWTTCVASGEG